VAKVVDPTGAGDTFAGAFFGYLAKQNVGCDTAALKQACVQGVLLASFTVQAFGVERLKRLSWAEVEARHTEYRKVTSL
jgi:sugar/nucleoside kinase (ribokinase family)